jgi:hypothetical protein
LPVIQQLAISLQHLPHKATGTTQKTAYCSRKPLPGQQLPLRISCHEVELQGSGTSTAKGHRRRMQRAMKHPPLADVNLHETPVTWIAFLQISICTSCTICMFKSTITVPTESIF